MVHLIVNGANSLGWGEWAELGGTVILTGLSDQNLQKFLYVPS